jgi:hypothetical protein
MTNDHNEFEPGDHFRLGGAEAEYLEVRVLSRSDAEDYSDGNWLQCVVQLAVGGFIGSFPANLRIDELATFATEVRRLYEDLRGTARFDSTEEQLDIVLQGDARGHIRCSGKARDDAGTGNLLTFAIDLDQTHLFGTMVQLEELLARFPVRGSPAA